AVQGKKAGKSSAGSWSTGRCSLCDIGHQGHSEGLARRPASIPTVGRAPCARMQRLRHFARQKRAIRWSSRDPLVASRTQKANWSDPTKLARLAEAYAVAGGDGREGGVSPGSARTGRRY